MTPHTKRQKNNGLGVTRCHTLCHTDQERRKNNGLAVKGPRFRAAGRSAAAQEGFNARPTRGGERTVALALAGLWLQPPGVLESGEMSDLLRRLRRLERPAGALAGYEVLFVAESESLEAAWARGGGDDKMIATTRARARGRAAGGKHG